MFDCMSVTVLQYRLTMVMILVIKNTALTLAATVIMFMVVFVAVKNCRLTVFKHIRRRFFSQVFFDGGFS